MATKQSGGAELSNQEYAAIAAAVIPAFVGGAFIGAAFNDGGNPENDVMFGVIGVSALLIAWAAMKNFVTKYGGTATDQGSIATLWAAGGALMAIGSAIEAGYGNLVAGLGFGLIAAGAMHYFRVINTGNPSKSKSKSKPKTKKQR